MITKASLFKRKETLESQRDNALATVNACCGALQLLESLIDEIDAPATSNPETPVQGAQTAQS